MSYLSKNYPRDYENKFQMKYASDLMMCIEDDLSDDELCQLFEQSQINIVHKCESALSLLEGDTDELINFVKDVWEHGW